MLALERDFANFVEDEREKEGRLFQYREQGKSFGPFVIHHASSLNLCKVDTPFCKYCGTRILEVEMIFMAYDKSFCSVIHRSMWMTIKNIKF